MGLAKKVIVQSGKKGYADSVKQKQDKLIANGISLAALAFFLGVFLLPGINSH